MSCFYLSEGALGNKNGSWFLGLVELIEGAPLDWSTSSQRGFTRESLGEPPTFKLWQTGRNNYPSYLIKTYDVLYFDNKVSSLDFQVFYLKFHSSWIFPKRSHDLAKFCSWNVTTLITIKLMESRIITLNIKNKGLQTLYFTRSVDWKGGALPE